MTSPSVRRVVVAVPGASGASLALRCLELLGAAAVERHLVVTPAGRRMVLHELPGRDLTGAAEHRHHWRDIASPIASGTFRTHAMLVVPCSARTLMNIAWGGDSSLLARAADVTLKERRRLVLAVRETPLHLGHLRAMCAVTEMGAVVAPPVPAFYLLPQRVEEVVDALAHRLVDLCGVQLESAPIWQGIPSEAALD